MSLKERTLQSIAKMRGDKNFTPPSLFLYLDELRKLKVTRLAELISIARETRTAVIGSVTDLGFFRYYGPDFSSFMSNLRTKIVMGGLDNESAKYFSDALTTKKVADPRYVRGGVMMSAVDKPTMDISEIKQIRSDQMLIYPHTPNLRPFMATKTAITETGWIKDMQVPPPKDIKEEYRKWGVYIEPLDDPILPRLSDGFYDMAKIVDETKSVHVNPAITPSPSSEKWEEGNTSDRVLMM